MFIKRENTRPSVYQEEKKNRLTVNLEEKDQTLYWLWGKRLDLVFQRKKANLLLIKKKKIRPCVNYEKNDQT